MNTGARLGGTGPSVDDGQQVPVAFRAGVASDFQACQQPVAQVGVVGAAEGLRVTGGECGDDGCGLGRGRSDAGIERAAGAFADGLGEVVVQAGDVALGSLGCLVLRHAADGSAEVGVLGEFGEFHPGVDLMGFGVVRQFGHDSADHVDEVGGRRTRRRCRR
ncbi:hypothetical protein [Streptomyces coeruleorubidus]|uniref:hypothetical protein n=1 Tax=Streptomyces coeruleorubidus TaxID=116188 RepID=UPI0037A2929D